MTASPLQGVDRADLVALGDQLLRLQRRRTAVVAGARLETSAFRLLWVLADGGPCTLRELAGALDLEQSTVNRQAHAALDAGWLERFAVDGSPAKRLRPTAAGRTAYEHDLELRTGLIASALGDLGPTRSRRLIADLTAFLDAWELAPRAGS